MADDFSKVPTGAGGKAFPVHKAGQFAAQCADIIDMGEKWEQYKQEPGKIARKTRVVFRSGEINPETGKPFEVSKEFTHSAHPKASLRAFLEAWLGKPFATDEAARQALKSLHKLEGKWAFLSIINETSEAGRTYAKIQAIMPLPEALPKPTLPKYERDPFWARKKAEYAAELSGKVKPVTVPEAAKEDFSDFPEALENGDDDDLPF